MSTSGLLRSLAVVGITGPVICLLGFGCDDEETNEEPSCEGLLSNANDCFSCISVKCCPTLSACLRDTTVGGCADCVAGDKTACGEAWNALYNCGVQACSAECTGAVGDLPTCDAPLMSPSAGACVSIGGATACNPLTLEGCPAGDACELKEGAFQCFPPGPQPLCQPCGDQDGFCQAGLSCFPSFDFAPDGVTVTQRCAKPCCDDGDCGSGTCSVKVTVETGEAGLCLNGNTTP
jgi:hypothetical protein